MALLAVLLIGVGVAVPVFDGGVRSQVTGQVENILEILDRRSPGERQIGELTKNKISAHAARSLPPQQRALGKIFPAPSSMPENLATPDLSTLGIVPKPEFAVTVSPENLLTFTPVIGNREYPSGSSPVGNFLPPGGSLLPPGGGVIVPPPTGGIVVSEPTITAVPEPTTWAMLIIGFAFCAAAMRRTRVLVDSDDRTLCQAGV